MRCWPPGHGRGRRCSRHAPRRTRARPPCTPTCTSPPTSTQAGTRLPGRPVACMLWLALLVCSLPGGLPLAARGRTRARLTPRTTFDIVPKTLPKTLPRYGMVTSAVLSSSLSSLLGDACAPRPRTRRSVVASTVIDVNKDASFALDTARRGAVPTAPIDARADRALDVHRLLCDLRHRLARARAVLFLSSPSAVALIVLTPSRPRPPKTNAAPLGIRLPRVIRWATRGAARLNRATTATSPPPPARASLLNGVSPHRPPSASRWGRAPARDDCATLTRRSHEGALTGPEGTEALTSWRRGDPRFR